MIREYDYRQRIKQAEGRFLYLVISKFYGNSAEFADKMGISPQYISSWLSGRDCMSVDYAGYLGLTHGFNAGLLAFSKYALLVGNANYKQMVLDTKFLTKEDKEYILAAPEIPDAKEILNELRKEYGPKP